MKKVIKLARDRIQEISEKNNFKASFYIADDEEFSKRLRDKLQEEVDEYFADNTIEELADILEVVYALAYNVGVSQDALEEIRKKKAIDRGAFLNKLIITYEKTK